VARGPLKASGKWRLISGPTFGAYPQGVRSGGQALGAVGGAGVGGGVGAALGAAGSGAGRRGVGGACPIVRAGADGDGQARARGAGARGRSRIGGW